MYGRVSAKGNSLFFGSRVCGSWTPSGLIRSCWPPPSHFLVANQSPKKTSHSMAHGTYVSAMSCPLSQSRLWRQSFTLFDFSSNPNWWGIEPRSSHRSSASALAQTSGNRPLLQVSRSSHVSHPSVGVSLASQISFALLCVTLEFGKRCYKAKSCCPCSVILSHAS